MKEEPNKAVLQTSSSQRKGLCGLLLKCALSSGSFGEGGAKTSPLVKKNAGKKTGLVSQGNSPRGHSWLLSTGQRVSTVPGSEL